jgi:hypothetical protein
MSISLCCPVSIVALAMNNNQQVVQNVHTNLTSHLSAMLHCIIRSAKQYYIYGASNIVLPCPGSWVIFHLVKDVVIIFESSI